jgi:hypothetical protein
MSIWGDLTRKPLEVADAVKEKHREYIGAELAKKAKDLDELKASLERREAAVSSREANLKKYYLVPRAVVYVPVFVLLCAGAIFMYVNRPQSEDSDSAAAISDAQPSATREPSSSACVQNGIKYYKEIESYPILSSGEDAELRVREMCSRSSFAFGE